MLTRTRDHQSGVASSQSFQYKIWNSRAEESRANDTSEETMELVSDSQIRRNHSAIRTVRNHRLGSFGHFSQLTVSVQLSLNYSTAISSYGIHWIGSRTDPDPCLALRYYCAYGPNCSTSLSTYDRRFGSKSTLGVFNELRLFASDLGSDPILNSPIRVRHE